ncbi:MAG: hypothetical protein RL148_363 [Planctomycetota bacterium]
MSRSAATRRLVRLLAVSTTALLVHAQEPAPPPTILQLQMRLKDPDTDAAAREPLAAELMVRGLPGSLALFDTARTTTEQRRRDWQRDLERFRASFAKAVPKAHQKLHDKVRTRRIEQLREQAAAVYREGTPTKERIAKDLDPIRSELMELVLLDPATVLGANPDLDRAAAGLRTAHADLCAWFDLYLRAVQVADLDPAGRKHVDKFAQLGPVPTLEQELDASCRTLALASMPLPARDGQTLLRNQALAATTDPEEFAGTEQLNRIRIAMGRTVVALDPKLSDAARTHSEDMRKLGFFSHESPVPGRRTFGDRAAAAGTSASAENIAWGQDRGTGAIEAWWHSPGHHVNMMGGHARTGLGRSESHWTQLFGG